MPVQEKEITETSDAFLYKGIEIPKLKRGQLNTYNATQIQALGINTFLCLVCEKDPIPAPDLGFTEAEWEEMEKLHFNTI